MKEEELKKLIEKFYKGESSIEEEKILKEYFTCNDVFPGFEVEKKIFSGYSAAYESIPSPSADIETRILSSIDQQDKSGHKHIPAARFLIPMGIAATLLIALGTYFFFIQKSEPSDTYKDPVIAYDETMKILNEISLKFNKGTYALNSLGKIDITTRKSIESIDRSASLINKSFQKIKLLEKIRDSDNQTRKINKN